MDVLEKFSPDPNTIIREEEVLTKERFDLYLFASDAVVLHKFQSRFRAVVSSTVYQIMDTGCPILVPKASDFFYPFSREVLKYSDTIELRKNLIDILNNGEKSKEVKKAVSSYVERYSDETIARKYLELFEKIKY